MNDWRDDIIVKHPGQCPKCGARVQQALMPNGDRRYWYLVEESYKGLVAHECRPSEAE